MAVKEIMEISSRKKIQGVTILHYMTEASRHPAYIHYLAGSQLK